MKEEMEDGIRRREKKEGRRELRREGRNWKERRKG